MTAKNGDLRYTEALKNEKSNSIRDLTRRRIQSRKSLICFFFVASLITKNSIFTVFVSFQFSVFSVHIYFEHNHAQPIPADSGTIIVIISFENQIFGHLYYELKQCTI